MQVHVCMGAARETGRVIGLTLTDCFNSCPKQVRFVWHCLLPSVPRLRAPQLMATAFFVGELQLLPLSVFTLR